jgi:hypothetical protein
MPYTPPDYARPPGVIAPIQAARERAVTLLADRYADDSISEAEFEARLAWLSAAESVERINELVADLTVARPAATLATTGYAIEPRGEQRLFAILSSTRRTGRWTMPPRLVVGAVMSELTIDFRYADIPPVGQIELFALMANVRIVVPPEMAVDATITALMASVRNDADEPGRPGAPLLRVNCISTMSEVRIEVKERRW